MKIDKSLTQEIRDYALRELNADLIGFANRERYAKAPPRMSPQGLMPESRSVIVMAVHHPDAAIEMGGREHPQIIGPYAIQYFMNSRLDELSYRMGLFLEKLGWRALPIVSSNIWRYKGYKEMSENFAPDLSHLHSAVAAGLAEFGYSGLAITPEFGARQRYVSIVTDAPLEPTPLLEPGTVCDMCMLCREECRSCALSKELKGWNKVEIEDKTYRYINKNLWRCAWGEHFDIDLDLPIPEHVNEEVILKARLEHGARGGEMGSCLRYCVPKEKRYFDPEYTNAPRRRLDVEPRQGTPNRSLQQRLTGYAAQKGADFAIVWTREELKAAGIDTDPYLPNVKSAITFGLSLPKALSRGALVRNTNYMVRMAAYDAVRELERNGYPTLSYSGVDEKTVAAALHGITDDREFVLDTVLTTAELEPTAKQVTLPRHRHTPEGLDFEAALRQLLINEGAVAVGITSAERFDGIVAQVRGEFDGQIIFDYTNTSDNFTPVKPIVTERVRKLKTPSDYLEGAKSVIVFALPLHKSTLENTIRNDAEAVGPLTFGIYQSTNMLSLILRRALALCESHGVRAEWSFDLAESGSWLANPRGPQPDMFSNRFAAVASGLARLGKGGFPINPEYGTRLRYAALIVDRELPQDELLSGWALENCDGCTRCLERCETAAFGKRIDFAVGEQSESFHLIDPARCDWAKRFSLIGEEGTFYTGWKLNIPAPETITGEALDAGLRQHPPIERQRPCNYDACILACPYTRSQP